MKKIESVEEAKPVFDLPEDFWEEFDLEQGVVFQDVNHVEFQKGVPISGILISLESDPWPHLILQKGKVSDEKLGVSLNFEIRKFFARYNVEFNKTAIQITPKEKITHKSHSLWQLKITAVNIDGSKLIERTAEEKSKWSVFLEEMVDSHNNSKREQE